ncbi:hypothetical protein [Arthrobacter sp. 2MCAF14]|uniref:hypothetical protein n=1 Tax=Arthrobacter sp. 2MCAF14 TaxID=3232982 RepID=UPI003F934B52
MSLVEECRLRKRQIPNALAAANPANRIVRPDLMVKLIRVILTISPVRPTDDMVQLH